MKCEPVSSPTAWVSSQKWARCESVSTVVPDLLDTMYPVVAGSIAPVTRVIASGSVVSSTWSVGCPSALPKELRSTSGQRLEPPMPSRTQSRHPASRTSTASALSAGKPLAHGADDVEPAESVVDHRCVRRCPPASRGSGRGARCRVAMSRRRRRVERYRGRPGVEVLALRVPGTHGVDLLGDAADQLVVRVRELLDAVIEQLSGSPHPCRSRPRRADPSPGGRPRSRP